MAIITLKFLSHARIACSKNIRWDIFCNYAARTNNTTITNCYARANHYTTANPGILTNLIGFANSTPKALTLNPWDVWLYRVERSDRRAFYSQWLRM